MANARPLPQNGIFTYHGDSARTGANTNERTLKKKNVKSSLFGKLVGWPVDGEVYAQPLYVTHVLIEKNYRNIVYVATQHDSVYAFDADSGNTTPLWHVSFIDPQNGISTVTSDEVGTEDI